MTHDWTVGGAIVESAAGLLLVRNHRRGGLVDWTPPGGVIDPGESVLDGLSREVEEETGLVVEEWGGPLYEVVAEAPDLGWRMRAEIHRVERYSGELRVGDDPDGIVTEAGWVEPAECEPRLRSGHQWVREPVLEWLAARWVAQRSFAYRVTGTDPASFSVTRL